MKIIETITLLSLTVGMNMVWAQSDNQAGVTQGDQVLDQRTNLIWQRCSVGQHWDTKNGCVGIIKTFTFDEAQKLNGNGWRVPSAEELDTLVDTRRDVRGSVSPLGVPRIIDVNAFPNMDWEKEIYWTSTPGESVLYGKASYFDATPTDFEGRDREPRKSKFAVRLVSANTVWSQNKKQGSPSKYEINGDKAYDKMTDLTWQRCSVGQHWDSKNGCVGVIKKFTFYKAQKLNGNGWRVPTVDELKTLLDEKRAYKQFAPTIDIQTFPNMDKGIDTAGSLMYWSTTLDEAETGVQTVDFGAGRPSSATPYDPCAVRLVREGR